MKRKVFASRDVATRMQLKNQQKLVVYSFFPIDRPDCACQTSIENFKMQMAVLPPNKREDHMARIGTLECPANKAGLKRYEVYCSKCGSLQGFCWASSPSLEDWVDFHYAQWTDGVQWYGCLTVNISPIDHSLTLECMCGNDTRDFRANMTLPGKVAFDYEEKNKVGRLFDRPDSKFIVKEVKNLKRDTIESRISSKTLF